MPVNFFVILFHYERFEPLSFKDCVYFLNFNNFTCFFIFPFFQIGGQVEILLVNYSNPDSTRATGGACDSSAAISITCDPEFEFCISRHLNTGIACNEFGRKLRIAHTNLRAKDAGTTFAGVGERLTDDSTFTNPLRFPFGTTWPVSQSRGLARANTQSFSNHCHSNCYNGAKAPQVVKRITVSAMQIKMHCDLCGD